MRCRKIMPLSRTPLLNDALSQWGMFCSACTSDRFVSSKPGVSMRCTRAEVVHEPKVLKLGRAWGRGWLDVAGQGQSRRS
jgi:hypothetical protein